MEVSWEMHGRVKAFQGAFRFKALQRGFRGLHRLQNGSVELAQVCNLSLIKTKKLQNEPYGGFRRVAEVFQRVSRGSDGILGGFQGFRVYFVSVSERL